MVGCRKMFPASESWPGERRERTAWKKGECAGGDGRTTGSILLPLCLVDKLLPSLVSSLPAGPTPPLCSWTTAICPHQALGTVPCPSWLTCLQMGRSGRVWAGRRAIPREGT